MALFAPSLLPLLDTTVTTLTLCGDASVSVTSFVDFYAFMTQGTLAMSSLYTPTLGLISIFIDPLVYNLPDLSAVFSSVFISRSVIHKISRGECRTFSTEGG